MPQWYHIAVGIWVKIGLVMAHCLITSSHYLNRDWLIISEVLGCHIHLRANSQGMLKIYILDITLKIPDLRLQPHRSGANELCFYQCNGNFSWKDPQRHVSIQLQLKNSCCWSYKCIQYLYFQSYSNCYILYGLMNEKELTQWGGVLHTYRICVSKLN